MAFLAAPDNIRPSTPIYSESLTYMYWSFVKDDEGFADGYGLQADINGKNIWAHIYTGSENSFYYQMPSNVTTIRFRVYAYRGNDESDYTYSSTITIRPRSEATPARPSFLNVTGTFEEGQIVQLNWQQVICEGYRIMYLDDSSPFWAGGLTYTPYTNTSINWQLPRGIKTITFRVATYNTQFYSAWRTSTTYAVAPRKPGVATFTLPSPITASTSINILWSAADYATGYELEVQVNGGTWSSVYTGANKSINYSVGSSVTTLSFRVRAYNDTVYGEYTTSAVLSVIPVKPSTPTTLNVPSIIQGLQSTTISWVGSGSSEGYKLEVQLNAESWIQLYKGPSLSFNYTPPLGTDTITFRVSAYNNYVYSNLLTSSTITVKWFPEFKIKIDGVLKTSDNGWCKIENELKQIDKIWVKIDGVVKEVQ